MSSAGSALVLRIQGRGAGAQPFFPQFDGRGAAGHRRVSAVFSKLFVCVEWANILPVQDFPRSIFNQLRPSVAFEALGPSQFAARAAAIGWAQPAGGMAGDTQPGAVVVHELNAMGYTQLALESQAKASLVQGCACT